MDHKPEPNVNTPEGQILGYGRIADWAMSDREISPQRKGVLRVLAVGVVLAIPAVVVVTFVVSWLGDWASSP